MPSLALHDLALSFTDNNNNNNYYYCYYYYYYYYYYQVVDRSSGFILSEKLSAMELLYMDVKETMDSLVR